MITVYRFKLLKNKKNHRCTALYINLFKKVLQVKFFVTNQFLIFRRKNITCANNDSAPIKIWKKKKLILITKLLYFTLSFITFLYIKKKTFFYTSDSTINFLLVRGFFYSLEKTYFTLINLQNFFQCIGVFWMKKSRNFLFIENYSLYLFFRKKLCIFLFWR